jgi:hypothetical protein
MTAATRRPYDPTPEQKARAQLSIHPGLQVLSDATTEALIQGIIVITHRIASVHRDREQTKADLRAQRDLIRAEILRRTGDGA